MATYTAVQLWAPQVIPNADTDLYTTPGGAKMRVMGVFAVNTSAAPITLNVTHGAMAVAGAICWAFSVPADGLPHPIVEDGMGPLLNAAEHIRAQSNAAAGVTLHGWGTEIT